VSAPTAARYSRKRPLWPHRAVPYVLPFLLFIAILALRGYLASPEIVAAGWIVVIGGSILLFSRPVLDLGLSRPLATLGIGIAVFLIWIAPDELMPGYRSHWLFQNQITGALAATTSQAGRSNFVLIALRVVRAVVIVPIVEELFWRAFVMRWMIRPDFDNVPLGTYETRAFWITAILFASEHGPYWDVGLIAGAVYNWWLIRTRRLGDVIWAHAITNACLCVYVLIAHKWEYWM
jgi:CAAX prenyl protease-like protein